VDGAIVQNLDCHRRGYNGYDGEILPFNRPPTTTTNELTYQELLQNLDCHRKRSGYNGYDGEILPFNRPPTTSPNKLTYQELIQDVLFI